jgi:hypothetical protein
MIYLFKWLKTSMIQDTTTVCINSTPFKTGYKVRILEDEGKFDKGNKN